MKTNTVEKFPIADLSGLRDETNAVGVGLMAGRRVD